MKKEKMKKKKKVEEENSRKSVRWSAVPVPCLSRLCLKLRGEQGSGPEGVDDLCFHTYGEFSPPPPPPPPGIGPFGWDLDLKAEIWVSRLGFGPRDWDLRGGDGGGEEEGGENPHLCESIGHRPLRGRCPKRHL